METHPNPPEAKSDAANCIKLSNVEKLWRTLLKIDAVVKGAKAALAAAAAFAAMSCAAIDMDADRDRLATAYSNCLSRIDKPAQGVVVPVEMHPDGSVKMDVEAEKAQFFDKEGLVWCSGVTIREYASDGTQKLELAADACIVDRKTKSGWLAGRAKGVYGQTEITGSDVWFSAEEEAVKVFSGVEVASSGIKLEGLRL